MYDRKCLTINFASIFAMLVFFMVVLSGCGKNGFGQKLFGIEADREVYRLGGDYHDVNIAGDSFGVHKSMIPGLKESVTREYKACDGLGYCVGIPADGTNTGTGGAYVETPDEVLFYRIASYYDWATVVRIEFTTYYLAEVHN